MSLSLKNKEIKFVGKIEMNKKYPQIYNEVLLFNKEFFEDVKWGQKYYNFINEIKTPPICVCGKRVKFHKFSKGYFKYCSNECRYNDINLKTKIKKTFIRNFGVDNPIKSKLIQEKIKKTNLEKYGVQHHSKSKEVKEKKRKTNLEKYGVSCNLQHINTLIKIKKTNLKKYNTEHHSKSKEVKEKKRKTNLEKYGVSCNLTLSEVKKQKKINANNNYIKKISELIDVPIKDIKLLENNNIRIFNYCKKHKFFDISKANFYSRVVYYNNKSILCTKCYKIKAISNIEIEFKNYLKNINNLILFNDRKILKGREIDGYFFKKNMGIEFNGLYWHSDKFKDKDYHLNKTELAEEKGIQLLHVFEDEWIFKKEIVKSIIKSKLGIYDQRIYARKCEIKEIDDNQMIRNFLEKNHLQGFVGSKYKLGLFYKNELVSLMTFGKKRISMGNKKSNDNKYEMLRFCNKLNTMVIGGASKLLKYFLKKYEPKSIISYADRRYSNGKLYEKLGFKFLKNTRPNYWYFNRNELIRYHRFNFRKDVLIKEGFDPNKTEHQIMRERGYNKIYDCGNKKYILN